MSMLSKEQKEEIIEGVWLFVYEKTGNVPNKDISDGINKVMNKTISRTEQAVIEEVLKEIKIVEDAGSWKEFLQLKQRIKQKQENEN